MTEIAVAVALAPIFAANINQDSAAKHNIITDQVEGSGTVSKDTKFQLV
jgi:hypothetical protein